MAERIKRITDALQLKQPDRIPIYLGAGYMLAEMYGVTRQEQHENGETEIADAAQGARSIFSQTASWALFNNLRLQHAIGAIA